MKEMVKRLKEKQKEFQRKKRIFNDFLVLLESEFVKKIKEYPNLDSFLVSLYETDYKDIVVIIDMLNNKELDLPMEIEVEKSNTSMSGLHFILKIQDE